MKDVIVKLLSFYVEYRIHLNRMKSDFWKDIDREWFHTPLTHEEFMNLMRGENK